MSPFTPRTTFLMCKNNQQVVEYFSLLLLKYLHWIHSFIRDILLYMSHILISTLGGSFVHGDSPGKNTGVGCNAFLQEIFPIQGSNQVSHIAGRFFTIWATREAHEYWSGWPIPSPQDLPDPGIKPGSPALQADSFHLVSQYCCPEPIFLPTWELRLSSLKWKLDF